MLSAISWMRLIQIHTSVSALELVGWFGGFCNGLIEDFRIYNYALSPGEVLSLAAAGGTATNPTTQPLLTPADMVPDGIVNFNDYAVMANKWHQEALFP